MASSGAGLKRDEAVAWIGLYISASLGVAVWLAAFTINHWFREAIRQSHPWTVNACGEWSARALFWPLALSVAALSCTSLASPADARLPSTDRIHAITFRVRVGIFVSILVWLVVTLLMDFPHCSS